MDPVSLVTTALGAALSAGLALVGATVAATAALRPPAGTTDATPPAAPGPSSEAPAREAAAAARLRTELESRGQPIGPLDTLIAGTAIACGAILVTRNTREFGWVLGLRIEDWY